MQKPKAIVVGGGLSGLAAAMALAENDFSVTVLESRPRLGGRASSFVDRETNTSIDNCQHVNMGCCTNFQHFCETAGIADAFHNEKELYFIDRNGNVNRFAASAWPAPLHLLAAFHRLGYVSAQEKRAFASAIRKLARLDRAPSPRQSFAEWLSENKQSSNAIDRLWNVVLVSALSETLDRVDVMHARKVFVDAFLANRTGWIVQIPTAPLDELYGQRLRQWLDSNHVELRLQSGAKSIHEQDGVAKTIELRNGEFLSAEHFVIAVPHFLVPDLLPQRLADDPQLSGISDLQTAPIASVHLWFDRQVTSLRHAVLIDRLSQWMFNRTELQSETQHRPASDELDGSEQATFYYQIVISAARNVEGLSQNDVIEQVVKELGEIWPEAKQARLLHSRLVTEHRAVFSPVPGVDALRPLQQTPIRNLQIAGDWTKTGWPGTMEGAVRSGYLAVENILAHCGRPQQLVRPDLPVSVLSKILLRL